jgi:ketosteroid isomerase-like protein
MMSAADQLRALLYDLYAAFSSGDPTPWTSHMADDVIGIGSDPDEWWEGRHVFADVVTAQVQEMSSAGVRLSAGSPRLFEYGDVAWCVDDPTLHLGDGTEVPMRVTLIAIPNPDVIQIKHSHFSVGSMNEQVFQQELTTE